MYSLPLEKEKQIFYNFAPAFNLFSTMTHGDTEFTKHFNISQIYVEQLIKKNQFA
jgi:hypothetical protein